MDISGIGNNPLKSTLDSTISGSKDGPKENFNFQDLLTNKVDSSLRSRIPDWVDQDYSYDPNNPRKPNMRELIEATSGIPIENLYTKTKVEIAKETSFASEMLYGVLGARKDTRDWEKIMASPDIRSVSREETAKMVQPVLDIVTEFDLEQNIVGQSLVIKDEEGNIVRKLHGSEEKIEDALRNFGVKPSSIPPNLSEKISHAHFDKKILDFVTAFLNKTEIDTV